MSTQREKPAGEASDTKRKSETSPAVRPRKARQRVDPVRAEDRRIRRERGTVSSKLLNYIKTAVAVIVWTMLSPLQIAAIAPYIAYPYAQGLVISIVMMSAILLHLWPTRTPQWRTLFWAFWITGLVGSPVLYLGGGPNALIAGVIAAVLFVFLRVNSNGRKLLGMYRDWRTLR